MNDRNAKVFPSPAPDFPPGGAGERLESWKAIAAYLNRGTRTVQRWERMEGLPVHRLRHDQGSNVLAYKKELDAWWAGRQSQLGAEPSAADPAASIAVLPFSDMSQEKDQDYFCEGIAEEILNALSRVPGLRVSSRASSFRQRQATYDSRELGRRLGVKTLLDGSVRKAGNELRITAQLIDAENGFQIWSQRFDREMSGIFAIQEEIARRIVEAFEVALGPKEREALGRAPTKDVRAYDYYLRGRRFFYQYGPQDMEFARQLFQQAIDVDPDYVLAHAGLADCFSYTYLYCGRKEEDRRQAEASSRKAVELDATSAQAQTSHGVALSALARNDEAEAAFETALRLDPNLFEANYFFARHCFAAGQQEKAMRLYEEAMRVRPEDYQSPLLIAQSYDDLGRAEEGAAARRKGVENAEEHLRLNPDDVRAVYMAANGLAALGERERSRQWADRALAMRPNDSMLLYNLGCIYAMLGLTDEALDCLEKAIDLGLKQKGWLERDSNLAPLRPHPRFQVLLDRMGKTGVLPYTANQRLAPS
jgi:TolB-like protein/Tfp pilus assembly protein PilF